MPARQYHSANLLGEPFRQTDLFHLAFAVAVGKIQRPGW